MTYPLIGNTGINSLDVEAATPHVAGLVVRELSPVVSSWRSEESLDSYLQALQHPRPHRHRHPLAHAAAAHAGLAARRDDLRENLRRRRGRPRQEVELPRARFRQGSHHARRLRLGPREHAQPQVDAHPGQARARRASPHRRGLFRAAAARAAPHRRVRLRPEAQHPAPPAPARLRRPRRARHHHGRRGARRQSRRHLPFQRPRRSRRSSTTRTRRCARSSARSRSSASASATRSSATRWAERPTSSSSAIAAATSRSRT